jgi:hypothetical protein
MPIEYKLLFNLPDSFTNDQLKTSYKNKLFNIQNNHLLDNTDKLFIIDQLKILYNQAKYDIQNRPTCIKYQQFDTFNKPIVNVNSYYKSYQTIITNDGITHVKEISESKNNDKVKKSNIEYKIDKDGKKMYITN